MQWEAWIFVAVRCWAMLCCAANAHRAKKHLKQTAWINVNDNWPETGNVYYIRLAWLFWQILWSGYLLFVLVMDVSVNVLCVCVCVRVLVSGKPMCIFTCVWVDICVRQVKFDLLFSFSRFYSILECVNVCMYVFKSAVITSIVCSSQ